jgi:hypothetical protein
MKVTSHRSVKHHITIGLDIDGDDTFESVHQDTYSRDSKSGKTFVADTVQWPKRHGWNVDQGVMDDDTLVTVSGLLYRKDGTLGQLRGTRNMPVSDLPDAVRLALIEAHGEVYAP